MKLFCANKSCASNAYGECSEKIKCPKAKSTPAPALAEAVLIDDAINERNLLNLAPKNMIS